jgi:hypothetical protein
MKRYASVMIALLLLIAPFSRAPAAMPEDPGKLPPDRIEMQDGSKEDDCDCCQKCQAAKRPVAPKVEPGATTPKDGCEDCCDRCGKALPSVPEDTPPDIIEKPKQ